MAGREVCIPLDHRQRPPAADLSDRQQVYAGHCHVGRWGADYLPLIDEVKRRGKTVCVALFTGDGLGLAPEVRLVADKFIDLTEPFTERWSRRIRGLKVRSGRSVS
jgi:hypothetical protein